MEVTKRYSNLKFILELSEEELEVIKEALDKARFLSMQAPTPLMHKLANQLEKY